MTTASRFASRGANKRRRRRRLLLEQLEPRIVLDGEFWLSALSVAGAASAPFDKLELEFSNTVDQATFDVDDVMLSRASGDIHPTAITDLGDNRFELDFGGQTSKTNYWLFVGPDIQDGAGQPMDQNRDGTAGDEYIAILRSGNGTIPEGDTARDGKSLILYGNTTDINGPHTFADVHVLAGATLRHSATSTSTEYRLDLDITDTLIVDASSKIDVSARGYQDGRTLGNTTSGAAREWAGGSYGGFGGRVYDYPTNWVYGDFQNPNELGSGGASSNNQGGSGGGLVRITADRAQLDGSIRANGGSEVTGGSGGGIWLDVNTLSGTGTISAIGGNGDRHSGGGGGGRVAIYYENLGGFDLVGDVNARGGYQENTGSHAAPGTVYVQQGDGNGTLRVDNKGVTVGTWTPIGKAGAQELIVDQMTITGNGVVAAPIGQMTISANDVSVLGGATLTHRAATSNAEYSLRMSVADTLIVDASSKIDVSARGYQYGRTLGNTTTGAAKTRAGGSYGGAGHRSSSNDTTNWAYGDFLNPNEVGSGGGNYNSGGGSGGGLVRIAADQLQLNGSIRANGGSYPNGGSGGGIWLDVNTLSGTGTISAVGGNGSRFNGSGGGGRVAVYYEDLDGFDLVGDINARGGYRDSETTHAAPGTVYVQQGDSPGTLRIDNKGVKPGTWTPLGRVGQQELTVGHLIITGSGVLVAPIREMSISATDVSVLGGATLTHRSATSGAEYSLRMTVADTLTVDASSTIDVSARGYQAGRTLGNTTIGGPQRGAGGAYGGLGRYDWDGNGSNQVYGDFRNPDELGTGGGNQNSEGAVGGGLVRIAADRVQMDGTIRAHGGNADGHYGGGGSGGGIWLDVNTLAGDGSISAVGGNGGRNAGGGGGGRIAVYYEELDGFDLVGDVNARGGYTDSEPTNIHAAPGTVYLQQGESAGTLLIDNKGVWKAGVKTPFDVYSTSDSLVLDELIVKGIDVHAYPLQPVSVVARNVSILDGSLFSQRSTTGKPDYAMRMTLTDTLTVGANSRITAYGMGYAGERTLGNTTVGAATGNSGGSYGGRGANAKGGTSNDVYGNAEYPNELGSGGAHRFGSEIGGAGGGLIAITAPTVVVDGKIAALGQNAPVNGGGGSGGAIRLNVGTLEGSGSIRANGGKGGGSEHEGGGGGGGGRIAVHYQTMTLPQENLIVSGGTGPHGNGQPGTVFTAQHSEPIVAWVAPKRLLHDVHLLAWTGLGADPATHTMEVRLSQFDQHAIVVQDAPLFGTIRWDTTTVPDGTHDLHFTARDGMGHIVAEAVHTIVINNSVSWHSGEITAGETWEAASIHVVEGPLNIAANVHVDVEPGALVKFVRGVGLSIQNGAVFDVPATSEGPVVLTSFYDDTAGGDTNVDGSHTVPQPGDWDGFTLKGTGQLNLTDHVDVRYWQSTHAGAIADSETWDGTFLHEVTGTVTIGAGQTLTIRPGAIVKLHPNTSIVVEEDGRIVADGTASLPITFTSIRDDSVGGDTNGNGDATAPYLGDWIGVQVHGIEGTFDHVNILYAGGSADGEWNTSAAAISTAGHPTVTIANSMILEPLFEGVINWGGDVTMTNTVVAGADRAVNTDGHSFRIVNCTLDNNRAGIWEHGAQTEVINTIISNSHDVGIQQTSNAPVVRYSNVWSPTGVDYAGMPNLTGTDGNISADPLYHDRDDGNYRLTYQSPAIDGGDGAAAPLNDSTGAPRVDDPRIDNTGTPPGNDFADLGAYEFVENAESDIDLLVAWVAGPAEVVAGNEAAITWTITNVGTGVAVGPWHDRVGLVTDTAIGSGEIVAGRALVGQGVTLGPGQTYTAAATVRVPGTVVGDYYWRIFANPNGDIFEGQNYGNNARLSLSSVSLDVPRLSLGQVAAGVLGNDQEQFFRVDLPAGEDIEIAVDLADASAAELHVGYRQMPTRSDSTVAPAHTTDNGHVVRLPATRAGEYYVLLYGRDGVAGDAAYEIISRTVSDGISELTPSQGSNRGEITLAVVASGLPLDPTVSLVSDEGTVREAYRSWRPDRNTIWATVDLRGLEPGAYDLRLEGDEVLLKEDAFVVNDGPAGDVAVYITGPEFIRAGRAGQVQVTYTNTGQTDVVAPLIRVEADHADVALDKTEEEYSSFVLFLGIGSNGPAGILAPGETHTVSVDYQTAITSADQVVFDVELLTEGSPVAAAAVDWQAFKSDLKPEYVSDEPWDRIFDGYVSSVGTTGGELLSVLSDNASYLSQFGQSVSDFFTLLAFEFQQAMGLNPTKTFTATIDAVEPIPASDMGFARVYPGSLLWRNEWGPLGWGWTHNWQLDLRFQNDGSIIVPQRSGLPQQFQPDGAGSYVGNADTGDQFEQLGDGTYQWRGTDGLTMSYDGDGLFASLQCVDGSQFVASYDAQGRMDRIEHTSDGSLDFTYHASGRIASVANSLGTATTFEYDASGEYLVSATDSSGRITRYTYDQTLDGPASRALLSVALPDGTTDVYDYDAQGRLIASSTDSTTRRVEYQYGSAGCVHSLDPWGESTTYYYDETGRLARVRDTDGRMRDFRHDDAGRITELIDVSGATISYTYDVDGNLTSILDAAGNVTEYGHGEHGELPDYVVDSAGNGIAYERNSRGLVVRRTMPDGSSEQYAFNDAGQMEQWTNRRGETTHYEYTTAGLLTRKLHDNGTEFTYSYDANGQLHQATGPEGTIEHEYNAQGYLARVEYPGEHFLAFTYDEAGRRKTTTDETGHTLAAHYDSLGRMERVEDGTGVAIVAYAYDRFDRVVRKDLGNGVYTVYSYTPTHDVATLTNYAPDDTVLSFYHYEYDITGSVTSIDSHHGTWSYAYDVLGQLVSADFASTDPSIENLHVEYEYDSVGNRIRVTTNGNPQSYESNELYQYTQVGSVTYTYDSDGNLASRTEGGVTTTYTYDSGNRLVSVDDGTDLQTFAYDPFGRLASTSKNGQATVYVTDPSGLGTVVAEYDALGNLVARYDSPGEVVRRTDVAGEARYYTFLDGGHTSELTDASGAITDTYLYGPFGQLNHSMGDTDNPFQYVGRAGVMGFGSDLMYMRNRFYSPQTGQFLSEDPLQPDGQNNRIYVDNAPIDWIDPTGLLTSDNWWNGIVGLAGMAASIAEVIVGVATLPAGGVGSILVVHGAYGAYANASNAWLSFQGKEPLSSGELLSDLGEWLAEVTGLPSFAPAGEMAGWATILINPSFGLGKVSQSLLTFQSWHDAATTAIDYGGPAWRFVRPILQPLGNLWMPGVRDHLQRVEDYKRMLEMFRECQLKAAFPKSLDPNEMVGPAGFGPEGFITLGPSQPYTITFENMASATAPAQEVFVTQQLDDDVDFGSVELGNIGFGDELIEVPPGRTYYHTQVDLTESMGLVVNVTAEANVHTGMLTWTFTCVSPLTGELPTNPLAGFLPPNENPPEGDGFVSYIVAPKSGLTTGETITAQASIVFDVNDPIVTNEALNTIDAGPPTSAVDPLPVDSQPTFQVSWSGDDENGAGSGIAHYDVYVAENGGAWESWMDDTANTSHNFTGQPGQTYAFYSVATDNVGHHEPDSEASDAQTTIIANTPPTADAGGPYSVDEGGTVTLDASGSSDPDQTNDTLTYEWDLDGDGVFGEAGLDALRGDETGMTPAFDATGMDGPASVTVTLRVTDEFGEVDDDTATVNVANADPAVDVGVDATIDLGVMFAQSGSFTDPGADTWTATVDYGDGSGVQSLSLAPNMTFALEHTYADTGLFTVTVTVDDGEDHGSDWLTVTVRGIDFGDAPLAAQSDFATDYPTLQADDGARHVIVDGAPFLGTTAPDAETDGQPDAGAAGDDNDADDDEDGVEFTTALIPGNQVDVTVTTTGQGYLNAWIDFNADGDWGDANEQTVTDLWLETGTRQPDFDVPFVAATGQTFTRFRYSSTAGLAPTGPAADGEVEDHVVQIQSAIVETASISGYVYADVNNNGVREDVELGLPNVPVTLEGPVNDTVTTDADGRYAFTDLPNGTYTVIETQPLAFNDGRDTQGTPALGTVGDDRFVDIQLTGATEATDYNFGERGLIGELVTLNFRQNNAPSSQELMEQMDLMTGEWYAFQAPANGTFNAHAEAEGVGLELYTADMMPVALGGEGELSVHVAKGESYVLHVAGDAETTSLLLGIQQIVRQYFTNPDNAMDVTGDGYVSPLDVLAIVSELNHAGSLATSATTYFHDVNGDGRATSLDVLTVISHLNTNMPAAAEAEPASWRGLPTTPPAGPQVFALAASGGVVRPAPNADSVRHSLTYDYAYDEVESVLAELESVLPAILEDIDDVWQQLGSP